MDAVARRQHILVIDDSPTICSIIQNTLTRAGYAVDFFVDELDAFTALQRREIPIPELVFLDIRLKQIDGYSVARMFRQKDDLANLVIVMISGLNGRIDRWRATRAGAKAYITKPFRPGEILNTVQQLIGPPVAASA